MGGYYTKVSYDRTCAYCGKEFEAHDIRKIYCSKKCKDIAIRIRNGVPCNTSAEPFKKICVVCGKQYETFRGTSVACSPECSKKRKRPHKSRKKAEAKTGLCVICGLSFTTQQPSQVTCGGDGCKREYKRIKHRERYEKHRDNEIIEKRFYRAIHTIERECVICGEKFYCLDNELDKTCSHECSRKLDNMRKEKRIPKAQRVDLISLKRLYIRDGGKCYLCGGLCSWDDWNISKNGNKYPGDTYPTIEHVVPVSKGGFNSWDNVRLAHWKCNLEKADGIIDAEPLEKEFAYSQKHSKTQKRRTAQYTLDGKLIRIWDSTAQIGRELGVNDKHIQNVCRGKISRTGNAYGYHWEYLKEVSNA